MGRERGVGRWGAFYAQRDRLVYTSLLSWGEGVSHALLRDCPLSPLCTFPGTWFLAIGPRGILLCFRPPSSSRNLSF